MEIASDAFKWFMATKDEGAKPHLFVAMVLAYCRPFTENYGLGPLRHEYPSFPDFPDPEMNLRHQRMLDIRNKLLAHSSIEGTKVWLLAPGAVSPKNGEKAVGYGYAVAKLVFSEPPSYVLWLHEAVNEVKQRLDSGISQITNMVGSKHLKTGEIVLLDTGKQPFQWTK